MWIGVATHIIGARVTDEKRKEGRPGALPLDPALRGFCAAARAFALPRGPLPLRGGAPEPPRSRPGAAKYS